ncbi:MAG: septum formation initiator family protein [Candidatus Cloacimonetes bacterium]|nr:septum formation initiator family protein [Candidatus Cloacimonadota bacterium]MCF7814874.1 septum formation initiator family protein [Candidatus Cloacimonadota bacterium]MCF7868149.1 septum formation initiator family protein [Candidatus Cloacimonadota bacterium]MCF7884577.1 septum formation initiator family protein [Candidatus Cloacimonadota bacterium]
MKIRKKDIIFYGIIIVLLLYIFVFDSYSYYRRFDTKRKLANVQKELEDLLEDNDRLREENERLANDKQIWEKKARELGMQKKGDEVYLFSEEE